MYMKRVIQSMIEQVRVSKSNFICFESSMFSLFIEIMNEVNLHISLMATLEEMTCSTYPSKSIVFSSLVLFIRDIIAKYITYLNHMKPRSAFYNVSLQHSTFTVKHFMDRLSQFIYQNK